MKLSQIVNKLQKRGVLCCFSLDYESGPARDYIKEKANLFIDANTNFKGYTLPFYNTDTIEELEEDGCALIHFEVVAFTKENGQYVWNTCVEIFSQESEVFEDQFNSFSVVLSEEDIDIPKCNDFQLQGLSYPYPPKGTIAYGPCATLSSTEQ